MHLLRQAKFALADATDERRSSATPAFSLPLRLEKAVADGHAHPDCWTSSVSTVSPSARRAPAFATDSLRIGERPSASPARSRGAMKSRAAPPQRRWYRWKTAQISRMCPSGLERPRETPHKALPDAAGVDASAKQQRLGRTRSLLCCSRTKACEPIARTDAIAPDDLQSYRRRRDARLRRMKQA
jgi:hypothetical protein